MRFSAAVMAGGRSRRMGRDKASLPAPPHGSLLARQLALLSALAPCERLVSARAGQILPHVAGVGGVRVVRDDGAAGPLGGLIALLRVVRAPRVLVLGVDLACIDIRMLQRIAGAALESADDVGVIPRTPCAPQPLAALWPRAILPLAEAQLAAAADLSLRTLAARGSEAGLMRWFPVPTWDETHFANWNRPADVRASAGRPERFVT